MIADQSHESDPSPEERKAEITRLYSLFVVCIDGVLGALRTGNFLRQKTVDKLVSILEDPDVWDRIQDTSTDLDGETFREPTVSTKFHELVEFIDARPEDSGFRAISAALNRTFTALNKRSAESSDPLVRFIHDALEGTDLGATSSGRAGTSEPCEHEKREFRRGHPRGITRNRDTLSLNL